MDGTVRCDMCCHWVQSWGTEKTSSGRKKKVQGDFLEEATSKLSGIKKKDIASLEEGREERAQGRNRSEKRSVTEEDTGEEDKGLPHTSHCLTGLDNVRPTAQGSFLPSFHQDVRASSGTEPRSWWKDTQAYSLSKRQRRLSFFKMCKFNEIRDPFYAVWLSAAGERKRVPPSEQQPATDRAADTFDHFLKVVCRPRFFSRAESDNIPNGLAFGKEGKIKASFSDNEGPLLSGIFDLCVYLGRSRQERGLLCWIASFIF